MERGRKRSACVVGVGLLAHYYITKQTIYDIYVFLEGTCAVALVALGRVWVQGGGCAAPWQPASWREGERFFFRLSLSLTSSVLFSSLFLCPRHSFRKGRRVSRKGRKAV